jgi:FKBP-type peptidyl-prolyl cis-trans isomerase SlpA
MHLSLTLADGTEALSTFAQAPECFVVGDGTLTAGLEETILGRSQGDSGEIELAPDQAFGDRQAENLHALPRAEFSPELVLEPGVVMAFETPAGEQVPGTIVAVDDDRVSVDFNHPLAGRALNLRFEILSVEPPAGG